MIDFWVIGIKYREIGNQNMESLYEYGLCALFRKMVKSFQSSIMKRMKYRTGETEMSIWREEYKNNQECDSKTICEEKSEQPENERANNLRHIPE